MPPVDHPLHHCALASERVFGFDARSLRKIECQSKSDKIEERKILAVQSHGRVGYDRVDLVHSLAFLARSNRLSFGMKHQLGL